MKNYSSKIISENINDIFLYQDKELDISLPENKIKFKYFTGRIHDPLGSQLHEIVASKLGIDIDDAFILKSKVSDGISQDEMADNVAKIKELESKIKKSTFLSDDDFAEIIQSYVKGDSVNIRLSSDQAKTIDRYVIALHSLPTSPVVLCPKMK